MWASGVARSSLRLARRTAALWPNRHPRLPRLNHHPWPTDHHPRHPRTPCSRRLSPATTNTVSPRSSYFFATRPSVHHCITAFARRLLALQPRRRYLSWALPRFLLSTTPPYLPRCRTTASFTSSRPPRRSWRRFVCATLSPARIPHQPPASLRHSPDPSSRSPAFCYARSPSRHSSSSSSPPITPHT